MIYACLKSWQHSLLCLHAILHVNTEDGLCHKFNRAEYEIEWWPDPKAFMHNGGDIFWGGGWGLRGVREGGGVGGFSSSHSDMKEIPNLCLPPITPHPPTQLAFHRKFTPLDEGNMPVG